MLVGCLGGEIERWSYVLVAFRPAESEESGIITNESDTLL